MNESQVARSEIHQEPALPWYQLGSITDFVIDFPEKGEFSAPVKYGVNLSNEVQVNYAPNSEQNQACIKLGCDDFSVQVQLTYTSNTEGTATIAWHEAGDTRHFRHVTFTVQDDFDVASRVELPEEIISTDPEPELNDGLTDIISRLEKTTYRSSTDKLYRKRLLTLLPEVMMLTGPRRITRATPPCTTPAGSAMWNSCNGWSTTVQTSKCPRKRGLVSMPVSEERMRPKSKPS